MKAVLVNDYGDIDEVLTLSKTVPVPNLSLYEDGDDDNIKKAKDKKKNVKFSKSQLKNGILIKTMSVALACGDCRMLSGLTKEIQGKNEMAMGEKMYCLLSCLNSLVK